MNKKIAGFWSVFDSFAQASISFITFLILARILPIDVFGASIFYLAIYQLANLPGETLFHDVVVQKSALSEVDEVSATVAASLIGLFCAIVLTFLSPLFARLTDNSNSWPVLAMFAFAVLFNSLAIVPLAVSRRKFQFSKIAKIQVLARAAANFIAVILAANDFGMWAFVAQQVISSAIVLIIIFDWRQLYIIKKFDIKCAKAFLLFGMHSLMGNLIWFASFRAFIFMIAFMFGSEAVAYISVAQRIIDTPRDIISIAAARFGLATLSTEQANRENFKRQFQILTAVTNITIFPFLIFLYMFAGEIILLTIGQKWLSSTIYVRLLSIATIAHFANLYYPVGMTAIGKPSLSLRISAISTVFSFIVLGIIGWVSPYLALCAWISRLVISMPMNIYYLAKVTTISYLSQLRLLLFSILYAGLFFIVNFIIKDFSSHHWGYKSITLILILNIFLNILFLWFAVKKLRVLNGKN